MHGLETDPTLSPIEKAQRKASIMLEASSSVTCSNHVVTTSSGGSSITTLSNGMFPSFGQGSDHVDAAGK